MIHHIEIDDVEDLILAAIKEDLGDGDVTSEAIFDETDLSEAHIVSKEEGVFCGADMIGHVYSFIDQDITVTVNAEEGALVTPGQVVADIAGPTKSILAGERIVLNFIQRMCGIASMTARVMALLENTDIKVLDTRKTVPGLRLLDKYAVRAGGGTNHRMGLHDMVMIKDNHIRAAGSITRAIEMVRQRHGDLYRIEVETTNSGEVREALAAGADIIMLDNMTADVMKEAAALIQEKAEIEVSGNVDEDRIQKLRDLPVDYISMGALTHSVRAFDLSMKFV